MKKLKITFIGAGSTIFAKNVLGDCIQTKVLEDAEYALFDIDEVRLNESKMILDNINKNFKTKAVIKTYLDRREALKGAKYVVNAIQVGGYDPCTIQDFEIPKKYGLRQTIADTIGIGGTFRALRTLPVLESTARDMEEVCPDAIFINYTNPMSILTGYMNRFTNIKTIGLCHSVQVAIPELFKDLKIDIDPESVRSRFGGINHMNFLLDVKDEAGTDLYPLIKKKAFKYLNDKNSYKNYEHPDLVRFKMMEAFGHYITESSEHAAEYYPYFIKPTHKEIIDEYRVPLDEYPRRCIDQIKNWEDMREELLKDNDIKHENSREYVSGIIGAIEGNSSFEFYGNVINEGTISNLPTEACVEVRCIANKDGVHKTVLGRVPVQCAALNMKHINVHNLVIEAYTKRSKEALYHSVLLDPLASSVLGIDEIKSMVDELLDAQKDWHVEYN